MDVFLIIGIYETVVSQSVWLEFIPKAATIKFSILKNELMFWMKRSFVRKETNVCFKENMRLFFLNERSFEVY